MCRRLQYRRRPIWIRVAQSWAGTHYGHLWISRINDKVIIQFVGGNIDRPVIRYSVYNGVHKPPAATNTGNLPGNKTISIIQNKMYKGNGINNAQLIEHTENDAYWGDGGDVYIANN